MAAKPNWTYCYSELLKQKFAIHKETGWVRFQDDVMYSPGEIQIIKQGGGVLNPAVHNVKKVFTNSEIVGYETGKRIKPEIREGELEIW